jgi:hypothetical protein
MAIISFMVQALGANSTEKLRGKLTHSFCKLDHFSTTGKIVYSNEIVQLAKKVWVNLLRRV